MPPHLRSQRRWGAIEPRSSIRMNLKTAAKAGLSATTVTFGRAGLRGLPPRLGCDGSRLRRLLRSRRSPGTSTGRVDSARGSSKLATPCRRSSASMSPYRFGWHLDLESPHTPIGLKGDRRTRPRRSRPSATAAKTLKIGGVDFPYPEPTSPIVSSQMRGNRSRDTRPEVRVRSLLHRSGLRFRKDALVRVEGLRIRTDIVFPSRRIAVFIDGCFWHGCPTHGRVPDSNHDYWEAKLARNISRDERNAAALVRSGWKVLRHWEHEPPESIAGAIEAFVRRC